MVASQTLTQFLNLKPGEKRSQSGISWQEYELLASRGEQEFLNLKISYLDGILEVMSPDIRHEAPKKRINILLEDYFLLKRIPYCAKGSADIRNPSQRSGKQPDESYCIGTSISLDPPDLVLEVIHTSGTIKNLKENYRRLGVKEIWIWQNEKLTVYTLQDEQYSQTTSSKVLPEFPLELLEKYAAREDILQARLEWREAIEK